MTVSSDWEDDTWQTHLNAYLVMLRQTSGAPPDKGKESLLVQALQLVNGNAKGQLSLNDPSKTDSETARLLIDVCKLRLCDIAQDLADLFERMPQPRKLDIQKVRLSVKHVYADALSVSGLISSLDSKLFSSFLIEIAAVQILAASLLIEFGEYLQPAEAFHGTREYNCLASSVSEASVAIRKLVSDVLPAMPVVSWTVVDGSTSERLHIPSITSAVSVIWPMLVVRTARNQGQTMQDWAGQTLYRVGQEARIPKALHLVRSVAMLVVCFNVLVKH